MYSALFAYLPVSMERPTLFWVATALWTSVLWCAANVATVAEDTKTQPGSTFRDCARCPEMVVVPASSFLMGDLSGRGLHTERPSHRVTIPQPFAVGLYEVTYGQWDVCVAEGGCTHSPSDQNWGRGNRAVDNVNWADAMQYVDWISQKSGKRYRLLTEAEWEYMARAGTTTAYPWGEELGSGNAVCLSCKVGSVMTIEVGQLPPNDFGIYDTVGSRREWVQDCWNSSFEGAPADGSPWTAGDCSRRVVRGGSWYGSARYLRSARRESALVQERDPWTGFRLARDL